MFCPQCGNQLVNGECPVCNPQQFSFQTSYQQPAPQQSVPQQPAYNMADSDGNFVSRDETLLYQLGSGYLGTFLAGGGITSNAAAVTNKRVYYRGKTFTAFGVGLRRCKATQVVDLKDINSVGVFRSFNIMLVVLGLLLFITSIILLCILYGGFKLGLGLPTMFVGIIMFIGAFVGAKTLLRIDYAGGCIAMDMRTFNRQDCEQFRLVVFRAKDAITNYNVPTDQTCIQDKLVN